MKRHLFEDTRKNRLIFLDAQLPMNTPSAIFNNNKVLSNIIYPKKRCKKRVRSVRKRL